MYLVAACGLLFFLFVDGPAKMALPLALTAFFTFFAGYFLVTMSQFSIWNPVGFMAVNGIQGRYLLPILPCLAVCVRAALPIHLPVVRKTVMTLLIFFVVVIQGIALNTAFFRYWTL
jgi:uncharacterized membrane protein